MAERTYELRAVFSATNNASRALNTIEKRIDKLQRKIDRLNGQTATIVINTVGDKKLDDTADHVEQRVKKLDKTNATIEFKADKSKLDKTLNTARKQLTKFENDDILVNFDANSRPMVQKAKAAKTMLDRMFAKAVEAELDVNGDRESIAKARRVQSAISKLARRYQFQIDYANAAATDQKLASTARKKEQLKKDVEFNAKLKGDREVRTKLTQLTSSMRAWAARPYEADLKGDASQAMRVLRSTESEYRRMAQKAYRMEVIATQRGMPEVAAQARNLHREAERLDGKIATVRTNLEGLPPVLQGLATIKRSASAVEGTYTVKIDYRGLLTAATAAMAFKAAMNSMSNSLANAAPLAEAFARKIYVGQQAAFAFGAALKIVAVGAIGPLVSGLTILLASIGAAATGFGLLAMAAMPIIAAFGQQAQRAQEVESAQKSLAGSAQQVASAQRGLADAQRGVADAARSGAEGIRSAVMAQKDAIQAVGDAQRSLGEAHAGVADARRAKEESVRAAVLAVADAYRSLQDAQRSVADAQRGVADARRSGEESVRSAVMAQKDAYRGVQDAQRSLADAHRGVTEARRSGEESIRSAIMAQQDAYRGIQDAQRSLNDAHRGVADARRAREEAITSALKQQRDAQRAVKDAVIALNDAHRDHAQATKDSAQAAKELNYALRDERYEIQDLRYEMQGLGLDQRELTLDIARARRELAEAENPEERARAQIQLERLLLREKQLTNDQRDAQYELNQARKNGSDQLQSARAANEAAQKAEADSLRNIQAQERALRDAREAAFEAEKGVIDARRDGNRQVADALRSVADAQRGMADAQRAALEAERNVAKARRDAAKQVADAQRGVLDAQRGLADAIRAVGEADRNVAKARADAARQVADAQRAVIDAQRGVRDAIRAIGEAERNVAKARRDGNKQIAQAQKGVMDAQRALKDAIEAVGEADRNVAKARQDAARQMADAQRAVADAQRQLAQALKEHQTNQQKLNELMAKQPAYIQRVMDKVRELKAAYKVAFAEANRAVAGLMVRLLDVAIRAMPKMGETAHRTAMQMHTAFDNIGRNWQIHGAMESLIRIMNYVPRITRQWTEAFGNFGGAFTNVMAIAMPYALRFSQAINRAALSFFKWTNSEQGRKRINDFFQAAAPVAKALGNAIWRIGKHLISWAIDHPEKVAAGIRVLADITVFVIRLVQRVVGLLVRLRENSPALWNLLKWATAFYIGFRLIPGPIRKAVIALARIAAIGAGGKLAAAASGVGMLGTRAGKANKGVGKLKDGMVKTGRNASGMIVPMNKAGGSVFRAGGSAGKSAGKFAAFRGGLARAGLTALRFVGLGNPVVGAVVAIGTAFFLAYKHSKTFRGAMKGLGRQFIDNKGLSGLYSQSLRGLRDRIKENGGLAKMASGRFKQWGKNLTDSKGASGKLQKILKPLGIDLGGLGSRFRKMDNGQKAATKSSRDLGVRARNLNKRLEEQGGGIAAVRRQWNKPPIFKRQDWGGKIMNLLQSIVTFAKKLPGRVGRAIKGIGKAIVAPFKWAYNRLIGNSILPQLANESVNLFKRLPTRIQNALKGMAKSIAKPFRDGFNGAKNWLAKTANTTRTQMGKAKDHVLKNTNISKIGSNKNHKSLWEKGKSFLGRLGKDTQRETGKAASAVKRNTGSAAKTGTRNHQQLNSKSAQQLQQLANKTQREMAYAKKQIYVNTKAGNKEGVKQYKLMYMGKREQLMQIKEKTAKLTNEAEKASTKNSQRQQEKGVQNAKDQNKWTDKAMTAMRKMIGAETDKAEKSSTKNTQRQQEKGAKNARDQKTFTEKAMNALQKMVGVKTNDAENKSTKNTQRMQENGAQNARDYRDIADKVFKEIRDNMVNPISTARDRLKSIWNGILTGIAKVLGAVGMDKAQKAVNGAKWANGGVTSDPSSVQYFAKGGIGTGRKKPRVHVWNEQMGNEAYITEKGKTKEQMKYLNTAAGWHGARVVPEPTRNEAPAEPPPRGAHSHINDQLSLAQQKKKQHGTRAAHPVFSRVHHNVYDWVRDHAEKVQGTVGGITWNTYHHHITAPQSNENSSIDFWGPGGSGSAIGGSKGDATKNAVLKHTQRGLVNAIWNRRLYYPNGSSMPFGNPHLDHVHVSYATDPNAKIVQGSGGGGFMDTLWNRVAEPIWKRLVDKPLDNLLKGFRGGYVMNDAVATAPKYLVTDPIKEMLMEKFDVSGSPGNYGPAPEGQVRKWIEEGFKFGNAYPPTDANVNAMYSRVMQESGGNPGAVNNWDSNAMRGTPSKGLVQIIEPTWESWRRKYGEDAGPFDSNWSDPVKSVGVSSRYMKDKYGRVVGANGQGYSNGGFARSPHIGLLGDRPGGEVMWPLGNNQATRAIVRAVQEGTNDSKVRSRSGTTTTIGNKATSTRVSTDSASIVAAIEELKRELSATLKEQLQEIEIGEDSLRTMYNAGFSTALKAMAHKKGREIIDEQVGEQINFDNLLGGVK